jgi:hypothetical protein
MSAFGTVSTAEKYPAVTFRAVGDSVAGRIVGHEDYQETDFDSKQPRFYPNSGDPVMGVRIYLETRPGDESSRVTLWCQGKLLMKAVATAFRGAGKNDIDDGDDLAVTFTGYDGRAKTYSAAYSPAETPAE